MVKSWTIQSINDQLQDHRQEADPLADEVFQFLKQNPAVYHRFREWTSNADLSGLPSSGPLTHLMEDIRTKHAEFDQEMLKCGHLVFEKYAVPIMAILALYSLPYCYAGENGSRILVQSKYLVENPRKRLEETGEFLFAVGSSNSLMLW